MSRGHSLSRAQSGRRVLEKCKAKGKIEIIDVDKVDKGKIDIVNIEEPGTLYQGSKGSKATRRKCHPDNVISIDDEEGDTDDTPQNLHCDATNNRSRPAPSSSPISEESQSDECLMSAEKGAIPFKRVNLTKMYNTASSSRNRFGLGSDYESSSSESDTSELDSSQSSESDSSDCELMEDSSGSIREHWERAAHRKKMSKKAHFDVEVQASSSSSSGDPGLSSGEEMQNKSDFANCSSKVPAGSGPFKRSNETENLSFNMPTAAESSDSHLKNIASTSTEPGTSDDTHYEEAGLEKKEHNSERCTGKAQSTDETFAHCNIAGLEGLEKLLRHPLCPPDVRRKFCFKDEGIFFLDNNMQDPVEISMGADGIHLEYYINKAFADYSARISSCTKDFAPAVDELINLLAKIGRNSSTDSNHTIHDLHEDSGFQKKEHIGETCRHTAQSPEEAFPDNKRVRSQCLEEPLRHNSCPSEGRCNIKVKDAGASTSAATELSDSFLKTKADCVSETDPTTDIPHEESAFQKKEHMLESPCSGKSSSCFSQPCDGIRDPPDNLGFQDKEEEVLGKASSITKSQCGSVASPEITASQNKEKLVFEETSFCKFQPSEKSMLSVDDEATHGKSACNSLPLENDFICERERHKESDEYRRAAEEEWAARQKELQIQAEEAQKLRRKRKAESLRLVDMERRQKERLEEIRESQKKDKETIHLKEKFRAEVRKELDRMEHIYRDMASLLRALGIPVTGGPYPLTREVNAAYKQALLRFHPDRASRTNIRQQVEAEEKFKLISRLKEKLQL